MNSTGAAPGSNASLRVMNRLRVLNAVRDRGPLTQIEIADATGLSPATVSNLVKELDAAGAVRLSPSIRNGRRAVQVSLAAPHGLVAAIVFGDCEVRVAVGTGGTEFIDDRQMPLPPELPADRSIDHAARLLHELVGLSAHTMEELRGVGVGLPTPIDRLTGHVAPHGTLPGWRGVPVATAMKDALGVPALIDNTTNLAALGEAKFGALQGISTGVFIHASSGVRAGLIIDGQPFKGSTGMAGEIGHVVIDEDGPICPCGNRGCLDTFVGSQAVLGALRASHGELTPAEVITFALDGDPGCRRVLVDAGRKIGVVVAGVVNLLNPEVVCLGGQLAHAGEIVLEPIRESIERLAISRAAASVDVRASIVAAADADVIGALALADQGREDADRAALAGV